MILYRLQTTIVRRWVDYAALIAIIVLIGGIAMGSLVVARRTQSAYPAFLNETNASDLTLSTYGNGSQGPTLYSPKLEARIASLPWVRRVESWVGAFAVPIKHNGAPDLAISNDVNLAASETGLYFNEDRVTPIQGRIADPHHVDEFMTTALGAHILGIHLNQTVPIGLYTSSQAQTPGFGTPKVQPAKRFEMKLVGIVEFNDQVVEDDTDRLPTNLVYTPAFAHLVPDSATNGTWYGIQLDKNAPSIASVEQSLLHLLSPGAVGNFSVTAVTEAKVERAIRPESIALGIFGLIAALAALGTALPVISRQIWSTEGDRNVLRALGAPPLGTLLDALLGTVFAIFVGSVLACLVAIGLSSLAPLGPIRAVYHPAGLVLDWTVLGVGLAFLVLGLVVVAVVLALRTAPERIARARWQKTQRSKLATSASVLGLPLPAVVGLRLAFERGRGRAAVPTRSVLLGAVVAVAAVTATFTFGDSLHVLASSPKLYGWNWNYALNSLNGIPPQVLGALSKEPAVASWSGFSDPSLQIDGQTVPALTGRASPAVGPPILSGHSLEGNRQIVLGAETLSLLHKSIGDVVYVSYGSPSTAPLYLPPTPARVVGTATFPAIAGASTFAEHTDMGVGALLATAGLPASFLRATKPPDPTLGGPALVFVRFRTGASPAVGLAELRHITALADADFARDPNAAGDAVGILSVQRPGEIVNYQSTGATPQYLAAGLGIGAAIALGLALGATVRRRRRELALLKTLGFTRGQLGVTLAWQATVTAVTGLLIGIPLGILAGREFWILFARSIDAVPRPAVPASIALIAVVALLIANLVATLPGLGAAATPAGAVLRQE